MPSYRGRSRIDTSRPEPIGRCDRCSFVWNLADLRYQYDWRGSKLVNLNIRVCPPCMDEPSNRHRTFVLDPDPLPVRDPRPFQQFSIDQEQTDYRVTEAGDIRTTEADEPRITETDT